MPRLSSLEYHFEQDTKASSLSTPVDDVEFNASNLELFTNLKTSASSCAQLSSWAPHPSKAASCLYLPALQHRPTDHAIISVSEPMPPILVHYFIQVLYMKRAATRHSVRPLISSYLPSESMDVNITGLSRSFYRDNGLYLYRTCAFSENNEHGSALLTYRRFPRASESPAPMLGAMLRDLPNLHYLRLGCRHLDSNFLTQLPERLRTLDIAFTDNNPALVASNLMTMRAMCKSLFTLAIAVSPLHDSDRADEGKRHDVFFDRRFVSKETEEMWQPFWKVLDEIKESRVKVWEGEGPGFRRGRVP
ncbi:MAG: hypothetical protein Q9163_002052 [Psora crenata]